MLNLRNKTVRAFTLVEAMMATVVLGIAAAGLLLPFVSGAKARAEGMHRALAAKLAADLMEEVVNKPFAQIVSGYDGYFEPKGQIRDAAGTVFADSTYTNFSRDVSCAYVYVPQEDGATVPNFIRVTVRVCYSGTEIAVISRLVSK